MAGLSRFQLRVWIVCYVMGAFLCLFEVVLHCFVTALWTLAFSVCLPLKRSVTLLTSPFVGVEMFKMTNLLREVVVSYFWMTVQANSYGYARHRLDDHNASFCLKMHQSPELSLLWQAKIVPCARSALRSCHFSK